MNPSTRSTQHPDSGLAAWENVRTDKGRADGCANTDIGPGRSVEEIDVSPILPPAADAAQPTPPMSRIDGCPDACGNTEAPYHWESTETGVRTYYGCEDCGQFWSTDWKD